MPEFLSIYEIVGALISIFSATITYLRSTEDTKKMNAAFVALLGIIFTMLFTLRFDVLPKLSKQFVLTEKVASNKRLELLLHETSDAIDIAEASGEPLMRYILDLRLNALQRHTSLVKQGQFVVDESEMPEFALEMMRTSKESILATSYVLFKEWWNTPWGKRYQDLNIEAVKRGVKITRIFIFSKVEDFNAAKPYLETQVKAGIDVKYIMANQLSIQITSDMVIVDNRLAGELMLTPEKGLREAEFKTRQIDISEVKTRINRVLLDADEYKSK